jgi:hypothetical protein
MTKKEMLDRIDSMQIYEKDLRVIRLLLANAEDKFFVKVMEEIFNGNLYFSDFERIFPDSAYEDTLKQNIVSQDKLRGDIEKLLQFRRDILEEDFAIDPSTTAMGIETGYTGSQAGYQSLYNSERDAELDMLIYQMISTMENDTELVKAAKIRILRAIDNFNPTTQLPINASLPWLNKKDLLLFKDDYVLPLDEQYQTLSKSDMDFMIRNNLSEAEVKKLKALAIFLKRKNV